VQPCFGKGRLPRISPNAHRPVPEIFAVAGRSLGVVVNRGQSLELRPASNLISGGWGADHADLETCSCAEMTVVQEGAIRVAPQQVPPRWGRFFDIRIWPKFWSRGTTRLLLSDCRWRRCWSLWPLQ
jgi:hypothetical protein